MALCRIIHNVSSVRKRKTLLKEVKTRWLKTLGWSHVLVVSDPFHEKSGRTSEITRVLHKAGLEVSVYSGVTCEPDTEMVKHGLQRFEADKCEGIVALGGGSVIDTV